MKSSILSLVCLCFLMTSIQAQNFNLKKFYGRWYEIAHDEDHPYIDDDATNVTLDFEEQPGAEFRMVLSYLEDGKQEVDEKFGFWQDSQKTPNFDLKEVEREDNEIKKFFKRYNSEEVEIVETDYTSYAVLFYKRDKYVFFDDDWGQIISRTPRMEPRLLERLIRLLDEKHDVERDEWVYPRQPSRKY